VNSVIRIAIRLERGKHTEKMMPLAKKSGWTIIDMKNDWKIVFPG